MRTSGSGSPASSVKVLEKIAHQTLHIGRVLRRLVDHFSGLLIPERVRKQNFLRLDDVLAIQAALEENHAGLRKLPGTVLKNQQTAEVVYEPPPDPAEVERLMSNFLEHFHRDEAGDPDPLVRMAVLHYQFESIHPFYDGNGRTGRILNLLHLVLHGLLDLPVLYLSRYVVQHKADYYRSLQAVRETAAWESWVLYVLRAVEETSRETLIKVRGIRTLMQETKQRLRRDVPKLYSQDLLNNLFRHPYTKIELIGGGRPGCVAPDCDQVSWCLGKSRNRPQNPDGPEQLLHQRTAVHPPEPLRL